MEEEDIQFTTEDGKIFHSPILNFDGPLDLLLYLIQQSEVNIYDIPIARITEQFIDYLNAHRDMDLLIMSSFYKMASELLAIKSRMLLPVDVEFDEEYEDPRKELVDQLIEYQKFRKYTELLSSGNSGEFAIMRKETEFMLPFADRDLFEGVTVSTLLETFSSLLKRIAPDKVFNVYESVTVGEKIALMDELLETRACVRIEEIIIRMDSRLDIICAFMAILECCKLRKITIRQDEPYGEILIWAREEAPRIENADEIDDRYDEMIERGFSDEGEEEETGPLHGETSRPDITYDDESEDEVINLDDEEEERE